MDNFSRDLKCDTDLGDANACVVISYVSHVTNMNEFYLFFPGLDGQ